MIKFLRSLQKFIKIVNIFSENNFQIKRKMYSVRFCAYHKRKRRRQSNN